MAGLVIKWPTLRINIMERPLSFRSEERRVGKECRARGGGDGREEEKKGGQRAAGASMRWCLALLFLFFFSSRRRHTRWPRDWSSDVCSSDLVVLGTQRGKHGIHNAFVDLIAVLVEDGWVGHQMADVTDKHHGAAIELLRVAI